MHWLQRPAQAAADSVPEEKDSERALALGGCPMNHILQNHVVDGSLTTFGCVEWESELFRGAMRARCYPFKMPKHRFHSFNPQVFILYYLSTYLYILCACYYVLVHTGTYHYIL
jgi:hypothetical protein